MAKRAAAGTLALAVCLGGGLFGAGAANAAITAGGLIRVTPSANPTPANDGADGIAGNADDVAAAGNQNAPLVQSGGKAQALADVQVVVPNTFVAGDQVRISLPSGVTFANATAITPAVSEATTTASLADRATPAAGSFAGVTKPAVTASYQSGSGVNKGTVVVQFDNNSTPPTGGGSPVFVLSFAGLTADIADTFRGAITVTPTAYSANAGNYTQDAGGFNNAVTTAGFAAPVQVKIPTAQTLVPGTATANGVPGVPSAPQSIGDITLSESVATGLVNGNYTIQFLQGDTALVIDDINPDGNAFDATTEAGGPANRGSATITRANSNQDLNLAVTGVRADQELESLVIKGLRISTRPDTTQPVQVVVTAAPGGYLPFTATNGSAAAGGRAFSQTAVERLDASESIGTTQATGRIGGNDRYETAARIAQQGLLTRAPLNGATAPRALVNSVIVTSGEPGSGGVDALSANYLAGQLDAPVLLTRTDSVPDATLVALRNLLSGTTDTPQNARIYVVGGQSAVSEKVVAELRDAFATTEGNLTLQRIGGDDRFQTAANTATNLSRTAYPVGTYQQRFGQASAPTAILTNGLTPADALSAGPIAYASNFPVMLTAADSVPAATLNAMDSLGIKNVVIAGGTTAISANVETQLKARGISTYRVAGTDRYDTAAQLYDWTTLGRTPTATDPVGGLGYAAPSSPYLANGLGFADALVAGPLAGRQAAPQPLLLTAPDALSAQTAAYLGRNKQTVRGNVTGVGLAAALPQSTLQAATQAARP